MSAQKSQTSRLVKSRSLWNNCLSQQVKVGRMILIKIFSPISFLPGEPNGSPHTAKPITSCGHITKAVTAACGIVVPNRSAIDICS